MTNEQLLTILKFSGPVVGLASGIWSTTQKITCEGTDGRKRLTLQGRVLIGITIVSTLISLLALGFETINAAQKAEAAKAENAAADQRVAAESARREALATAATLAQLQEAAKIQKGLIAQQSLITAKAEEQRQRDSRLSLQVAREANQRLAEAERTLAEFERINYPLRKIEITVALAINFGSRDTTPFWVELAKRSDLETEMSRYNRNHSGSEQRTMRFPPSAFGRFGFIPYSTNGNQLTLDLVTPSRPWPRGAADTLRPAAGRGRPEGSRLSLRLKVSELEAVLPDRRLTAFYTIVFEPDRAGELTSGEKLSVSDAKRLDAVLTIVRAGNAALKRPPDRLVSVRLDYNDAVRFDASPAVEVGNVARFVLVPAKDSR